MKKTTAVLLAIVLIFALAACGSASAGEVRSSESGADDQSSDGAESAETDDGYAKGQAVAAADSGFVLLKNNLDYRRYTVSTSDGGEESSFMQFYGLKDKAVEESINKQISDVFNSLTDEDYKVPYEGFYEDLAAIGDPEPGDISVDMYLNANSSNILSVCLYRSEYYFDESSMQGVSFSDVIPLNFDLNTGKQIRITDLLYDGADPGYINDKVKEFLEANKDPLSDENSSMFTLKSEFSGIKPDQKFYIDDYSAGPVIILDYVNTELYTGYNPLHVNIDTRGVSAYTQRFASSESLFEDGSVVKSLANNYFDYEKSTGESDYRDPYYPDANIIYSMDWNSNSEAPAAANDYAVFTDKFIDGTMKDFRAVYDLYLGAYPGGLSGNVWMYSYVSRVGEFVNVSRNVGRTLLNLEDYTKVYDGSENLCVCLRGDSPEPIAIEDIFKAPQERSALMKKSFRENIKRFESYEAADADSETLERYFDEMIGNINGFNIETESVHLSYGVDTAAVAQKYFPDSEQIWQYTVICDSLYYSDLGCDNLTIFD